ncbi:hypothetical protein GCM10018954_065710 [Kutzneria kofuensis]
MLVHVVSTLVASERREGVYVGVGAIRNSYIYGLCPGQQCVSIGAHHPDGLLRCGAIGDTGGGRV